MPASATSTHFAPPEPTEPSDRSRALALFGPLLLFVHGILGWLDGLDGLDGFATFDWRAASTGPLAVASGLVLVGAVAALTLLTAELGEHAGRGWLATGATIMAAFGAGAVAAVTAGRIVGLLGPDLSMPLTAGGPVLVAAGLAAILYRLVLIGLVPIGSALVATAGAAIVAVPWQLLPLGALVLLIGFAPLVQRPERRTHADPAGWTPCAPPPSMPPETSA